ncbi:hypothetical protein MSG28_000970 [Choristoneura fumiferana]|uniref:Uncharacterized protein n=1 Tax=Choristoneura fumiferana TaxID=7141 RepID=A0ACC0K359_CHOFU|nr:hypothetical protein MSG28_000970 [Choristoneura fumiferana]
MMKKLSILFVFLVVSAVLTENVHAGYDYRAPAEAFQPQAHLGAGAGAQSAHYNSAQQNYALHSQNKFVPLADDFYRHQYRQPQQEFQYNSNYQAQYNSGQSNNQNVNYNSYSQNFGNAYLSGIQNGQHTVQPISALRPSNANIQAHRPVITKHIYFHLPPADDSAAAAPVTATPPKKTYNIIFIKLPSLKSASAAQLQQLINEQAAIENKTLIYVLVRKPETQPTQPITSKPEVFFVKYKDPRNVAQQVNTGVVQVPILQSNALVSCLA